MELIGINKNMAVFLLWDYWEENNTYYAVYETEDKLYFSEVAASSLEYKKPKVFSKVWFQNLFKRKNG